MAAAESDAQTFRLVTPNGTAWGIVAGLFLHIAFESWFDGSGSVAWTAVWGIPTLLAIALVLHGAIRANRAGGQLVVDWRKGELMQRPPGPTAIPRTWAVTDVRSATASRRLMHFVDVRLADRRLRVRARKNECAQLAQSLSTR